MRNSLLPLLVFLAINDLSAQVTLTAGQASPAPGETYTIHMGPWEPPTFGTTGGTMDYSTFSPTSSTDHDYVAPSSTSYAAQFPGSTVAEVASPGIWAYYVTNASGYYRSGIQGPSYYIHCASPFAIIPYPLTYDDQVTDPYTCSCNSGGSPFTRTGEAFIYADEYGSLALPYGTIANVLRVQHQDTYTDAGSLINEDGITQSYFWYKPGVKMPLFAIFDVFYTGGGSSTYSWMLDESSIGIDEALDNAIGIELYPNPATDEVNVVFGASGRVECTIVDGTGRTALFIDLGQRAPGVHNRTLQLDGLAPGIYTVRLVSDDGSSGVQRLIVQ